MKPKKKTPPPMTQIGTISNYYGGLYVKKQDGRYFWCIVNYSGDEWQEITEKLYNALIEFEETHP